MPSPQVKKTKTDKTKYIFVVGGVMSGVGKGITAASIGRILASRGFKISAIKIDPYINVDAGTMNPTEHGEVFVTKDGDETDQDVGNYERFLNVDITRDNYMTTGRVYLSIIQKERNLEFKGKCVEVVPHVPQEVINRIKNAARKSKAEIMIVEIGGTIGEYQNLLFLEAARMMHYEDRKGVQFVMVSYMPVPGVLGEMKTKPTQHAIRTLNGAGIHPDFLISRSPVGIDEPRKNKLAWNCAIPENNIISAPDVESIYDVPLNFEKDGLGDAMLKKLGLRTRKNSMGEWKKMVTKMKSAKKTVNIGIVGKYFSTGDFVLADSYISVIEALKHGSIQSGVKPKLHWINAEEVEQKGTSILKKYDGIVVPQGWGSRGSEGKIKTIQYCRENKVPYLGLCYGMQMAVIEFARNVLKFKDANSEEVDPKTTHPVIHIMPEQKELIAKKGYGGTIRLGEWPCKIKRGTHLSHVYKDKDIVGERHRHRYEFNNAFRADFEKAGLTIAGTSPDGLIVEAIEIKDHPFFIGTQFHPEYISRPLDPHPLFTEFLKVCGMK